MNRADAIALFKEARSIIAGSGRQMKSVSDLELTAFGSNGHHVTLRAAPRSSEDFRVNFQGDSAVPPNWFPESASGHDIAIYVNDALLGA